MGRLIQLDRSIAPQGVKHLAARFWRKALAAVDKKNDYRPFPVNGICVDRSSTTGLCVWDYSVDLPDGKLLMKRIYRGSEYSPPRNGNNVTLLVHGFAENGNVFRLDHRGEILNIDEAVSLANQLAMAGEDVFIVHFWGKRVNERYVRRQYGPDFPYIQPSKISFDHVVQLDFPAVLDSIEKIIGGQIKIKCVAHSLGAPIVLAYLSLTKDKRICSLVSLAGGWCLDKATPYTSHLLAIHSVSSALGLVENAPLSIISAQAHHLTSLAAKMPQFIFDRLPGVGELIGTDVSSEIKAGFLHRAAETISPLLIAFFAQLQMSRQIKSLEESQLPHLLTWSMETFDTPVYAWAIEALRFLHLAQPMDYTPGHGLTKYHYQAHFHEISIPVLLVAGGVDRLIPPGCALSVEAILPPGLATTKTIPGLGHLGIVANGRRATSPENKDPVFAVIEPFHHALAA